MRVISDDDFFLKFNLIRNVRFKIIRLYAKICTIKKFNKILKEKTSSIDYVSEKIFIGYLEPNGYHSSKGSAIRAGYKDGINKISEKYELLEHGDNNYYFDVSIYILNNGVQRKKDNK